MVEKPIARREFAKGAAAGAAVAAAGTLAARAALASEGAEVPPAYDATVPETWDRECEVVVVGSGIAGCCAAVEGYDLGLDVLVVTATDDITDCSCTLSGGWLCGCGTSLQELDGIEDSVDLFVKDVRRDGGDFGDPDIIEAWAQISGDTVDWLWDLGCDVVPQTMDAKATAGSNSHSVARDYITYPTGNGLGWMTGLQGAIEERGIEVVYSTPVDKIYRAADGQVVGVHATAKAGGELNIRATKAVIMAAGGLGHNMDQWALYSPVMRVINEQAKRVICCAPDDVNGDSAVMLQQAGAFMYPTIANYGCSAIVVDPDEAPNGVLLPYVWPGALIEANADGNRFNDETSFSVFLSDKPYRDQPGMWFVVVFDSEALATADGQTYAQPILDKTAENGITETVCTSDTIEGIAEHFGMDPANLVAAVEDFNAHVDSQEPDQFGRTVFAGKIATPPFYAIEQDLTVGTSKGGARINAQFQVIDNYDQIIPGLYAIGEAAFFLVHGNGQEHIVGGCNSSAACSGRIAARAIAQA